MSIIASAKLGARLLRVSAWGVLQDPVLLVEDLPEARLVHGVALLAEWRGVVQVLWEEFALRRC